MSWTQGTDAGTCRIADGPKNAVKNNGHILVGHTLHVGYVGYPRTTSPGLHVVVSRTHFGGECTVSNHSRWALTALGAVRV